MERALANVGPPSQTSEWAAEHTVQPKESLQAQMTNLREENHIALTNLDSKVEQLSEGFQSMGQTFHAHADSVHTEVLWLQSVSQSRPPR